jgi:hypothetical protein
MHRRAEPKCITRTAEHRTGKLAFLVGRLSLLSRPDPGINCRGAQRWGWQERSHAHPGLDPSRPATPVHCHFCPRKSKYNFCGMLFKPYCKLALPSRDRGTLGIMHPIEGLTGWVHNRAVPEGEILCGIPVPLFERQG